MIIDFHMHVFPDGLASRALGQLSQTAKLTPCTDGTVDGVLAKMSEWGVDAGVFLHIATNPKKQAKVNDFAAEAQNRHASLYSFGSVHPDAPDAVDELVRIKALDLKGVKLHPDYQGFFADEERMDPIYDACSELGLPVVFHAGYDPFSPAVVHAPPAAVARVVRRFPRLTVVAAHMGGFACYEETLAELCGLELYFDTSMSAPACPLELYRALIKKKGAERILFASDNPWSSPPAEAAWLERVGLSSEELDLIYHKNAERLLGLA